MKRMAMILIFVLLVAVSLAQVWVAFLRVDLARQRHDIQLDIQTENKKIDKLSLEYASLTRPERLRKLAHEQLGMQAPTPEQLIRR